MWPFTNSCDSFINWQQASKQVWSPEIATRKASSSTINECRLKLNFRYVFTCLLWSFCGSNPSFSTNTAERTKAFHVMWENFSDTKKILDVWEISIDTQRRCEEGWAVQNTALGNCTPSCKSFPVWTGRTLLPAVCFSSEWWVSSCLGCGHTVHSSYTHTPRWKQNSVGAASQTLVRECICTERQRKMHVILFLQQVFLQPIWASSQRWAALLICFQRYALWIFPELKCCICDISFNKHSGVVFQGGV